MNFVDWKSRSVGTRSFGTNKPVGGSVSCKMHLVEGKDFIKPLLDFVLGIEQRLGIQWSILWQKRANDVSEDTGEDRRSGVFMRLTKTRNLFLGSSVDTAKPLELG
jgi:hypothetical protein